MIGQGFSVVYQTAENRVTIERDDKTAEHIWISVEEILLLVACHLHATHDNSRKKKRRNSPLADQTIFGAFISEVMGSYRKKFGDVLPNQSGTLLWAGEMTKVKSILLSPERRKRDDPVPALSLDTRYLLTKDPGGQLVFTLKEWKEFVLVAGVEVLAPIWSALNSEVKRQVPDRVREQDGAEELGQVMKPNWFAYGVVWIWAHTWLCVTHWWRRHALKWDAATLSGLFREGVEATRSRADEFTALVTAAKLEIGTAEEQAERVRTQHDARQREMDRTALQLDQREAAIRAREEQLARRLTEIEQMGATITLLEGQRDMYRDQANSARNAIGLDPLP